MLSLGQRHTLTTITQGRAQREAQAKVSWDSKNGESTGAGETSSGSVEEMA